MNKMIPVLSALLLAACASVPRDAGFAEVRNQVIERVDQPRVDQVMIDQAVQWRRSTVEDAEADVRIGQLLAEPVSADGAVQLALLNNRTLQAEYEELGVAQADLVQAGLLKNPSFGWSRLEGGGLTKTTWGIELDFLGLLLRAPKQRIETLRFEHTKLRVAQAVLKHAMETRKAWVDAVAAEQSVQFLAQVAELTAAEAELGERQRAAGNLGRRDALRQQAFAAETANALTYARFSALAASERLGRLMGIAPSQWKLVQHLPALPASALAYDDLESEGLSQRLDVRMAQKASEAMAAALHLTRDTRLINVLDLGVETEKATGEKRITGPTLRLELPIFDQGQARVSKQEAQYRQSEARLYALAVDARSEIREHYQRAVAAYAMAKHQQDVLVPLRRQIVEQSTLQYNGMLIGVYELLADAREQVSAVQNHISATREFWNALADLQMAVGGKLPEQVVAPPESGVPETKAAPSADAAYQHDHHQHGGNPQ